MRKITLLNKIPNTTVKYKTSFNPIPEYEDCVIENLVGTLFDSRERSITRSSLSENKYYICAFISNDHQYLIPPNTKTRYFYKIALKLNRPVTEEELGNENMKNKILIRPSNGTNSFPSVDITSESITEWNVISRFNHASPIKVHAYTFGFGLYLKNFNKNSPLTYSYKDGVFLNGEDFIKKFPDYGGQSYAQLGEFLDSVIDEKTFDKTMLFPYYQDYTEPFEAEAGMYLKAVVLDSGGNIKQRISTILK